MTRDKAIIAVLKYGLVFALWMGLSIAEKLQAQDKDSDLPRFGYSGIEASFGFKQSTLKSQIPELNGLNLLEEGGNVGILFGNSFSRFVVRPLGFYSATGNIGRTINLFAMEAENNTYLLKGLTQKPTRFDIYTLVGLNFSSFKFFGHYIHEDLRPSYNNKPGKEPYLGKLEGLMITAGLGIEYKLLNNIDFVHLYMAGKYQLPIQISTSSEHFEKTQLRKNFDLSLGLRFGLIYRNDYSDLE